MDILEALRHLIPSSTAQPQARGLLSPPTPVGGLLGGVQPQGPQILIPPRSAAPHSADVQGHTARQRDPNDYSFGEYVLGALAAGSLRGAAQMALQQTQRHHLEARNRAGAASLFSDLGAGMSPPSSGTQALVTPSSRVGVGIGSRYGGMGPGSDGLPLSPAAPPARPQLSRSAILAAVAKAQANGFDATPYLSTLNGLLDAQDQEAFLQTAPEADRPLAAINPKGYSDYQLDRRKPRSGENDTVELNPATGQYERVYTARQKPPAEFEPDPNRPGALRPIAGGGADPAYIGQVSGIRAKEQRANAPPMWQVYGPSSGGSGAINSTGDVMGPIYNKIARGQPLTGGEQKLYEDGRRAADPFATLLATMGGGGQQPRPQALLTPPGPGGGPPRPQAPASRGSGARAVPQDRGVYRPTSAADMASIPKGAKFLNPANGQVLTKAR